MGGHVMIRIWGISTHCPPVVCLSKWLPGFCSKPREAGVIQRKEMEAGELEHGAAMASFSLSKALSPRSARVSLPFARATGGRCTPSSWWQQHTGSRSSLCAQSNPVILAEIKEKPPGIASPSPRYFLLHFLKLRTHCQHHFPQEAGPRVGPGREQDTKTAPDSRS